MKVRPAGQGLARTRLTASANCAHQDRFSRLLAMRTCSADMSSVGWRSMDCDRDWDGRPVYYDRQGEPMTMQQWAQRFEDEDYRHIARDVIGPDEPLDPAPLITVSTFWLGLNHNWRSDEPLIYETIIIGGEHDATGMRYATEKQARDGHRRAVDELRAGRARHRRVDIRHD